jgi:hypothetical protein
VASIECSVQQRRHQVTRYAARARRDTAHACRPRLSTGEPGAVELRARRPSRRIVRDIGAFEIPSSRLPDAQRDAEPDPNGNADAPNAGTGRTTLLRRFASRHSGAACDLIRPILGQRVCLHWLLLVLTSEPIVLVTARETTRDALPVL